MDPFNEPQDGQLSETEQILNELRPMFEDEFKESGYEYNEMMRIYIKLEALIDGRLQSESIVSLLDLKSDIITFLVFFDQFGPKFILDLVMHDMSDEIVALRKQIYHETMTSISRAIVGRELKKDRFRLLASKKERIITKEIDSKGREETAKAITDREIAIAKVLHNKINTGLKKIMKEFKSPEFELSAYSKAIINYFESLHSQWMSAEGDAKELITAQIIREMGLVYICLPKYKAANVLDDFKPIEKVILTPKLIDEKAIVETPIETTTLSVGGSELVLEVDSIINFLSKKLSLDSQILERINKAGKEITIIVKALLNTPPERLNQKIYELLKNYKRFGQSNSGTGIIYILQDKSQTPLCKIAFKLIGEKQLQIQFLTNELQEIPVEIVEA